MLDSNLTLLRVVVDSASGLANSYGSSPGGLIAYRGDSSLFVDRSTLSMLVLDASGDVARVMALPRADDSNNLVAGVNGIPAIDSRNRLVFRAEGRPPARPAGTPRPPGPTPQLDSALIVRLDLVTKTLDTAAWVKTRAQKYSVTTDSLGRWTARALYNPLPVVDDWTVLTDGTIALVRGVDYHVDFVSSDGARTTSPRVPFDWRRLTDTAKVVFLDSAKAALEKIRSDAIARDPLQRSAAGLAAVAEAGAAVPFAVSPGMKIASAAEAPLLFVSPRDLPDYAPPFSPGAVRRDEDGNLWIRTNVGIKGGAIYDILNSQGELVDRRYVQAGRVISGFGKGGLVYLGFREGDGTRLERARWR
jgi:hypothetical protein